MADVHVEVLKEVHRKAAAETTSKIYSMDNPYLSVSQKAKIEAVYQFPFGVFAYAFACFTIFSGFNFWHAYWYANAVGAAAWLAARFLPGRWFWPVGLIFGGNLSTWLTLSLAAILLFQTKWAVAAFLGLAAIGFASPFEAPMWLWPLGTRFNPKYEIAKRMFNVTFPFEAELE